jgi:hypothetical protein
MNDKVKTKVAGEILRSVLIGIDVFDINKSVVFVVVLVVEVG